VDLDRGREREGEGEERGEGGWRGVLGAAGGAGDREKRGSLHKNTIINKNKIQYNYVLFKSRYLSFEVSRLMLYGMSYGVFGY